MIEKKRVQAFYQVHILGYVVEDLKELRKIQPNSVGLAACAIPSAMACIASMDLIGFLFNPEGKKDTSGSNIDFYIKNYLNQYSTQYNDTVIESLKMYRHGMMHNFFPQNKGKFAGIMKDSSSHLIVSLSGKESLNVNVLLDDHINSLINLGRIIDSMDDTNSLFEQITKRLKEIDLYLDLIKNSEVYTTINPGTFQNR